MEFFEDLKIQLAENISEEIHCHNGYEILWMICGEGQYRDESGCFPGCCRRECLPFAVFPKWSRKRTSSIMSVSARI